MKAWHSIFIHNPLIPLLNQPSRAIVFFTKRDLMNEKADIEQLWKLPEAQKILRKQKKNGSWEYPGAKEHIRSQENYDQIETYRNLGYLIEQFAFNKSHPSINKAAEFLFKFQSKEGDFRGIYGNQYTPNYTAGIAELLIKAGYENDARIKKVFQWLIKIRQSDGGWAIPIRTKKLNLSAIINEAKCIEPDRSKPFSHMVTGVVLRAFAAHPYYKNSKEAHSAAQLLISHLFQKDNYQDRAASEYWLRFTFPFWFTDLISAMDSLSKLGFNTQQPEIKEALTWFIDEQNKDGLWHLKILKGHNKDEIKAWLSLCICRIFKQMDGNLNLE